MSARFCLLSYLAMSLILHANPAEERFELGARMKAMGGIGITQAHDFSATYYNPANLSFCPQTVISIGYNHTATRFKSSRNEGEIPLQLGTSDAALLGACLKLPFNIALGAYGSFGASGPTALQFRTVDKKVRFPFYDHSLNPPSVGFGLSIRPISWFSLGVATSITIHTDLRQRINLPISTANSDEMLEIDMTGSVHPTLPFVGGLTFEPLSGLRLAAVFRSARYNKFEDLAQSHLELGGIKFDVKQNLEGSFGFSPMQVGAGISYKFCDFTVGSDLTWYQWSAYKGPFLRIRAGKDSEAGKFINYPPDEEYNFNDIWLVRVGAEYVYNNMLSARFGYAFRPKASPEPATVAQLIDSDTHMLSGGCGYKHSWDKIALELDVFFSAHLLPQRNLNYYSIAGWAYDTGLALALSY